MSAEKPKEPREISGIYFRFQNPVTGGWGNRVFEDLPEAKQDEILNRYTSDQAKSLAKILANRLYEIAEQFDITCVNPEI